MKIAIDERNMWIVRATRLFPAARFFIESLAFLSNRSLHSGTWLGSETESWLDSNFELLENSSTKTALVDASEWLSVISVDIELICVSRLLRSS